MADWCNNKLKVVGPSGEVKRFIQSTLDESGAFSLNKLIPIPEESHSRNERLEWSEENWGTKWDVNKDQKAEFHITNVSEEDNEETSEEASERAEEETGTKTSQALCDFGSPWTPPIAWQLKVSELFPTLTFSLWHDEPSGDIAGLSEVVNGETLDSSWEDSSYFFVECSAPNCYETAEGPAAWNRTADTELGKMFCDRQHALEAEIFRVISEEE